MSNFIQKCLNGKVLIDDIDDFIHEWHSKESELEIYDYLGMTRDEDFLWVTAPDTLPHIVNAHRSCCDVKTLIENVVTLPLAARTDGIDNARRLLLWLRQKGYESEHGSGS